MNPAVPSPEPSRREVFVRERRVEIRHRDDRIGRARDRGDERAIVTGATAERVDHLAQRCPHRELADTVASGRPGDRAHEGARRFVGADTPEPGRAVFDDARDVGERLDVVDQGRRLFGAALGSKIDGRRRVPWGRLALVETASVRRGDARERLTPFDDFEERRLLPEQVVTRAIGNPHRDVVQTL